MSVLRGEREPDAYGLASPAMTLAALPDTSRVEPRPVSAPTAPQVAVRGPRRTFLTREAAPRQKPARRDPAKRQRPSNIAPLVCRDCGESLKRKTKHRRCKSCKQSHDYRMAKTHAEFARKAQAEATRLAHERAIRRAIQVPDQGIPVTDETGRTVDSKRLTMRWMRGR